MALAGTAFLALFNGFDPAHDDEYNVWHSVEHVPERLTMPGITRARRYVNREDADLPYFTLYELASIDAMYSDAYLRLLSHRSDWTNRMRPFFGKFFRAPCRTVFTRADGVGAAVQTIVLRSTSARPPGRQSWEALALALGRLPGLTGVHAGACDTAAPAVPGLQAPARADAESMLVVMVEAQEEKWLVRHREAIDAAVRALEGDWGEPECRTYRLMHLIDAGRTAEETARLLGR
ncbi:hypothetical protein CDO44_01595 [Pigmentiphaga sp. NML080357]|uniref:hypothetical protein n=1 Tax=Pigmentiphaga sp. NML080357 TaxID=2008675 RepID=UPI000B40A6EB|nr:hypothetical protein [Pigmentiphaga sp. NML080357]OVZ64920.1 hypothetical protein CDO44_01595 [Pigmentiphaga sp. NML080357]